MATLDEILNFGVPALLIIIVLGFLWVKFIEPWVVPMISKLWEKINEKREERTHEKHYGKEIQYE